MITIPTGKILIISVKIISVVMSILMLMFIFGEGLPDIGDMSPRELILLVCFAGMLVGMILVWFKIKAAAWTIPGSAAAFWLVEVIYTSGFWIHWFFLIFPLTGIMIFLAEKYESYEIGKPKKSSRRK